MARAQLGLYAAVLVLLGTVSWAADVSQAPVGTPDVSLSVSTVQQPLMRATEARQQQQDIMTGLFFTTADHSLHVFDLFLCRLYRDAMFALPGCKNKSERLQPSLCRRIAKVHAGRNDCLND
jgi:hypothetical protein